MGERNVKEFQEESGDRVSLMADLAQELPMALMDLDYTKVQNTLLTSSTWSFT
jgi:hypothetical protein